MVVGCVEGSRGKCLSTLLSEERGKRTRPERRVTVGAPHFDSESARGHGFEGGQCGAASSRHALIPDSAEGLWRLPK